MNSTRKHRAAYYLTLLITVTLLSIAMAPATLKPVAATGSDAQTPAPSTPTPPKVRYNGKIVFMSDRQYTGLSIWSMNPDGSSPTRLTDDKSRMEKLPDFSPVYDNSPVWSPDGTKIAFISNRNYLFTLYVMNADGSNSRLVADLMEPGEPAWSPDGNKIAFSLGTRFTVGWGKAVTNIYVINVDGSGLTQLTRDSGVNGSPTWSPDGKQIAFVSNRDPDGISRIWVMNADGSNQRIIPNSQNTKVTGFPGGQPAWSPDGTKILFLSYRLCPGDVEVAIHVMNADGSDSRLLTNDPNSCGVYSSPRWSPDGTKIVASLKPRTKTVNPPEHPTQIIVMNADGSNPINISNRGKCYFQPPYSLCTDVQADWQPLSAPLKFEPSIISFVERSYTVYNDAGKIEIPVKRTGNLNDVASCFYVTYTDPLIIHGDPGTLRFAPGESLKTISIPVMWVHWGLYKIVLSDNGGNATFVGGIREATLNILKKSP